MSTRTSKTTKTGLTGARALVTATITVRDTFVFALAALLAMTFAIGVTPGQKVATLTALALLVVLALVVGQNQRNTDPAPDTAKKTPRPTREGTTP